jgi:hypothetical protein
MTDTVTNNKIDTILESVLTDPIEDYCNANARKQANFTDSELISYHKSIYNLAYTLMSRCNNKIQMKATLCCLFAEKLGFEINLTEDQKIEMTPQTEIINTLFTMLDVYDVTLLQLTKNIKKGTE